MEKDIIKDSSKDIENKVKEDKNQIEELIVSNQSSTNNNSNIIVKSNHKPSGRINNTSRKPVPYYPLKKEFEDKLLRIMSYNILADSLSTVSIGIEDKDLAQYPYLKWEERRKNILNEINFYKPDIICIQEFERDSLFVKELNNNNYDLMFVPRPGDHSEGCAVAFKTGNITLLNTYSLIFNMNINSQGKDISNIYDRDNCCCIAVLKYNTNDEKGQTKTKILVVASAHFLFNIKRGDIKLGQAYQLVSAVNKIKEFYASSMKIPIDSICSFIGADMNSLPCSGIYKFLTEGYFDCAAVLTEHLSGQHINVDMVDKPHMIKKALLNKKTSKFDCNTLISKPGLKTSNKGVEGSSETTTPLTKETREVTLTLERNKEWYNDIRKVEVVLNNVYQSLNLDYAKTYKYEEKNLVLYCPIKYRSAYSSTLQNCSNVFLTKKLEGFPFDLMDTKDVKESDIENLECFSIRSGNNQDATKTFLGKLTLEPPTTSCTEKGYNTVDYILYEGKGLEVVRVLDLPNFDRIINEIYLMPNEGFPSDHFSLVADFIFRE